MAKATKKSASALTANVADAVFGYTVDGNVLFYLAAEGEAWRAEPERFVAAHTSRCLRFASGRRPVLALVREGEGLWFDDVEEWFEAEAKPNALVAFDVEQARTLVSSAGAGDLLVLLGAGTTWASLFGGAP